jgi:hypothetical protein
MVAEPDAAPDRGRMEAFRGSMSHRRPRQVSWVVGLLKTDQTAKAN